MTLRPSSPRAKSRWVMAWAGVGLLVAMAVSSVLAVHLDDAFELDKDGTAGSIVTPVGYVSSNITATATTIPICQTADGTTFQPVPIIGDFILVQSERMTVVNPDAGGSFGGSCAGVKRNYTVTRGAGGTTATAHVGGANKVEAGVGLIRDSEAGGPDWDQVATELLADGDCEDVDLVACTFIYDGLGATIYTIGSTKDHLPISGWFHTTGASPDKADIINAYAAKAIDPSGADAGNELLYFGMDRYAVDGSTDIGFWFFQDEVVACVATSPREDGDPCQGVADGEFAGDHVAGDLLALGTFTQGGATTEIRLFKWVGDANGTVGEQTLGVLTDCRITIGPDDQGCATVNNAPIEAKAPWEYSFKGDTVGGHWIPLGGFFEGGIDLTALGLDGCFSSFLAETRSSPELTAILKDFALGSFESCDTGLVTTPSDGSGTALVDNDLPTDGIPDIQIGTGAAGVDVTDSAELEVKGISDWSGTLDFYLCGPILETAVCDTGGYLVDSQAVADEDATTTYVSAVANLTSVGYYCWRAEFTSPTEGVPDATDDLVSECFEVTPVTPTLTTTAGANVEKGTAVTDTASLTGTAYQPGSRGSGVYQTIDADMVTKAAGSITFELRDSSCAATGLTVTGSPVTVDGDNASYGPVSATPTATGTYHWVATYDGNSPNTNGTSHNTDCSDSNETVQVVDAKIEIAGTATNEVGVPHTFTVTVWQDAGDGAGFAKAPVGNVDVVLTDDNGSAFVLDAAASTCDENQPSGDNLDDNGQCVVVFTSDSAGQVTGDATVHLTVGGVSLTRNTDGVAPNSGDAVKTFVDAYITIAADATNEVSDPHTFTVSVFQDDGRAAADPDGDGATGFTPALVGNVDVELSDSNGAFSVRDDLASSCDDNQLDGDNLDAGGQCIVVFTSGVAGQVTGHATVALTVGGVPLSRNTDGVAPNSDDAVKTFVDAYITISPDEDTNEVGDDHTFTINVYQDDGIAAGDGGDGVEGFGPAPDGTIVTVSLTDANGAAASVIEDTCAADAIDPPDTDGTVGGACTVTISSASAGKVTASATVTFDVGTVELTRATDGEGNNSDVAVKFFVDAYITIGEDATNTVGDPHTFTINVYQDDGREAADPAGDGVDGFGPAPDGTIVDVTLTDTDGASHVTSEDTCAADADPLPDTDGTLGGACSITFTSPTAGTVTGHAAVTFPVGGVSISRNTDGFAPNSDDAVKIFVAGSISWSKVDNGDRLQGGATFEVCQTHTFDIEGGVFVEIVDQNDDPAPICFDVEDNGSVDEDADDGEFLVSGLPLGRYTVMETVAPDGYEADPDTEIVELVPGDTEQVIALAFENSRPIVKITGFGYTNEPEGDPQPDGIFNGKTVFTVDLENFGDADAHLVDVSSLVVTGDVTCEGGNTLDFSGITIEKAGSGTETESFSLTCHYTSPDPTLISATLEIHYETNNMTRTASGSPATISFTVDPD
ncbi:MAG: prealbumin-like fold domain-containing protein [Chloroflexi bacterium]|nr:prealbumin-like fold domain-containing protein [Chloroflexota bacterium]